MPNDSVFKFFGSEQAANYDSQFARLAPIRDALHLFLGSVLAELPADARILCVGAGTGAELLYLAQKYPGWHFTAVEPSGPMLDICKRRAEENGLSARCTFHEGYLESLPASEPFDAATSLLVSHFILSQEERTAFFRGMAERLRPQGYLVNADLAWDVSAASYESLLKIWLRVMASADIPPDKVEMMRQAYARDVAILPLEKVSAIIQSAGFEEPVLFLQTGLIHGWYSRLAAQ